MEAELAFQAYGPREDTGRSPLVVLHGLFGSASNWRGIAKRLAERHTVFTVDLRNHGTSPHTAQMSYAQMAADVRHFIDARGLCEAIIMGHSMGGKVAMRLALDHPARVESLIVVDIAPVPYDHDFVTLIDAMRAVRLQGIERRADAEAQLLSAIPEPALRSFLLQNLVNETGGFRWRINLQAIAQNMPAVLDSPVPTGAAAYSGPTVFLRGENSEYVRAEHHGRINELFPKAQIEAVPGAGHWLHAEQPTVFLARVGAFLER